MCVRGVHGVRELLAVRNVRAVQVWVKMAGKGAGVKTAWSYHNQPSILPMVYEAGMSREDVFLETMVLPSRHH